jgi:hypothetical protein
MIESSAITGTSSPRPFFLEYDDNDKTLNWIKWYDFSQEVKYITGCNIAHNNAYIAFSAHESSIFGQLDPSTGVVSNVFGPSDGAGNLNAGSDHYPSVTIMADATSLWGVYYGFSGATTDLSTFKFDWADIGTDGNFAAHSTLLMVGETNIYAKTLTFFSGNTDLSVHYAAQDTGTGDYYQGLIIMDSATLT